MGTVHLYPVDNNAFIDGVPKVEMEVDQETADAYLAYHPPVFTTVAPAGASAPRYDRMKLAELQELAASRGLGTDGKKAGLIERLSAPPPPSEVAETTTGPAEEAGSSVSTPED